MTLFQSKGSSLELGLSIHLSVSLCTLTKKLNISAPLCSSFLGDTWKIFIIGTKLGTFILLQNPSIDDINKLIIIVFLGSEAISLNSAQLWLLTQITEIHFSHRCARSALTTEYCRTLWAIWTGCVPHLKLLLWYCTTWKSNLLWNSPPFSDVYSIW